MNRDSIDLGQVHIPQLFRKYFAPTLLGMLSLCMVTATDGIFVGHGCGSDALAAVNIVVAPTMILTGIGLMLGVGTSVVSSIHLARNNIKAARINITQALLAIVVIVGAFLAITLPSLATTGRILGSSEALMPYVLDYMPWVFVTCLFSELSVIGLFIIRLDGSPRYAMWCNVIPGLLNIFLDWLFIFPLDMGVEGAAIATMLSCMVGGLMVIVYLFKFANTLKPIRIKAGLRSLQLTLRNLGYQCKIGISALLGESTMGMLMLMGNLVFMHYMGDDAVGAFSIACYYSPFVFMIGNAIAQSAQPIISYNYGLGAKARVVTTERLAIIVAVVCGATITLAFCLFPDAMVGLFLSLDTPSAQIAIDGFPWFAIAFIFFIFNLTAIGYFQSVEKVAPSVIFALLRGAIFLVPSFLLMPMILGHTGIWLALAVSEIATTLAIVGYYLYVRRHSTEKITVEAPK